MEREDDLAQGPMSVDDRVWHVFQEGIADSDLEDARYNLKNFKRKVKKGKVRSPSGEGFLPIKELPEASAVEQWSKLASTVGAYSTLGPAGVAGTLLSGPVLSSKTAQKVLAGDTKLQEAADAARVNLSGSKYANTPQALADSIRRYIDSPYEDTDK